MKNLKGTKTEQNLIEAFKGESVARNKYTYFASKAKKEGLNLISKIFQETSDNEKEHAKIWFKLIDKIDMTKNNLISAINTEGYESKEMYPEFAKVAQEEGFDDIAKLFREVAEIESGHEKRYKKLLTRLENDTLFVSAKKIKWICQNCGYIYDGNEAPSKCPACSHPKEYFERFVENY